MIREAFGIQLNKQMSQAVYSPHILFYRIMEREKKLIWEQ